MSVINTNITSLIAQGNLGKSQSALQTSMERLSSGLRINSAKDDAAGQAIANRMTAQITGLNQAQRNANDGISIAQTAEGSLNQVNDNLQRIRELSVQAQNGTNSADDLTSIQEEINQRLDEINRISDETAFNSVSVLAEDQGLTIQVGANDGETITVNLKQIDASTLGLSTFNVDGLQASKLSSALTTAGDGTTMQSTNIQANSATPPGGPGPNPSGVTVDGLYQADTSSVGGDTNGFAVKGDDGNYYALTHNAATDAWTWDSSTTPMDEALVDVENGPVTDLPVMQAVGTLTATETGTAAAGFSIDYSAGLFQRNDVEVDPAAGGADSYAVLGNDGNYYAIEATTTFTGTVGVDEADPTAYTVTYAIDLDPANLEQVSAANIEGALTDIAVGEHTVTPSTDLLNEDLTAMPTSTGALHNFAGAGENEYAVAADDGNFYVGTFDPSTGAVAWDSSSAAIDASDVDTSETISEVAVASVQGSYTGLAAGETLHSYTDADGQTAYAVKSGTGEDAVYTKATLGTADATTGDVAVTKETGDDATIAIRSADPLEALDSALNQVDSLRSELGAVQNRFEDAINNLRTNSTNLSAARSRIEDADYAVEVANMTRAQILQQAGTSVLAQANQIPQIALSLLG